MSSRRHRDKTAGNALISAAAAAAQESTDVDIDSSMMSSLLAGTSSDKVAQNAAPRSSVTSATFLDDSSDEGNVSLMEITSSTIEPSSVSIDLGSSEVSAHERYGLMRYVYLFVLFIVFTSNIFDRYLIVFLYSASTEGLTPEEAKYQSMQVDLNITSTQYGILTGPAFMITLAISALIAGQISGSVSRKWVITIALLIWSGAIGGLYFAEQYWHVLVSRFVLGAAEAMCPPLAYSMISSYFDKHQRASANGFFASGIYVGYGLSTLSLMAVAQFGWRMTCAYIGAIGGLLAVIQIIFLKEPVSDTPVVSSIPKKDEDNAQTPLLQTSEDVSVPENNSTPTDKKGIFYFFHLISVILRPNDIKVLLMAAALRMIAGVILGAYLPPYIKNAFPKQRDEFTLLNVFVVVFGGTISTVIGGRITSSWGVSSGQKKVKAFAQNLATLIGFSGNGGSGNINTRTVDSASVDIDELGTLPVIEDYTPYGLMCALSCLISTPIFAIVFWADNLYVAMGALFVAYLFSECWFAPIYGILQNVDEIPQYARLMSFALVTTSTSFFAAFAPVVLGIVDDKYHNKQMELTVGVLVPIFLAGLLFLYVAYSQSKRTVSRLQQAFLRP